MRLKALGVLAIIVACVGCGSDDGSKPDGASEGAAGGRLLNPSNGSPTQIPGGIPPTVVPMGPAGSGAAGAGVLPGAAGRPAMQPPAAPPGVPPAVPPPPGQPPAVPPPPGQPPAVPPPPGQPPAVPPPPGQPPAPTAEAGVPIVPMRTATCPTFRDGTINFMGLGGITVVAGSKASSPTAPMVFYWHGTGSFAGEYAGSAAAVASGVRSEGGVLISFQNTTGGDGLSGTLIFGKGDFDLADQLFACAVENHNVDPKRVFATGCSAGGLFSGAMAALRSNYIAAAAPNSGGLTFPQAFQNKANIPALMSMHGAPGVDVVIIDFSQSSETANKAFKAAGGFVINCNHGGIHCGAGGLSGGVWDFFKAHPYGTKPSPWASGLPAGFPSACKIY